MFKNLVALVNGGASRLGQATAIRLAKKGAQIVLTDSPQTNGATIAKEIGENIHFIPTDARCGESVETLVDTISKNYGKLNVVVNCLGLENTQKDNNTDDLSFLWDRIETTLSGTFNMMRLASGLMGENEPDENYLRGVIINTFGLDGIHRVEDRKYIACTHGVVGMMRSSAIDFSSAGIRVNTIIPPLNETSSPEVQTFLKENNFIVASKMNNDPDNFAHVVQTIIANPYINMTSIDLSGGVSRII